MKTLGDVLDVFSKVGRYVSKCAIVIGSYRDSNSQRFHPVIDIIQLNYAETVYQTNWKHMSWSF